MKWFKGRENKDKAATPGFKVRRLNSYALRGGMFVVFVGTVTTLLLLLLQYTDVNPSTKEDVALAIDDPAFVIPVTACNAVAAALLMVYYFATAKIYRPHRHHIEPGRMTHLLVAMALGGLAIALAFVMMAVAYTDPSNSRNTTAIALLAVSALTGLAAVGYEQWAVYRIERDILKAKTDDLMAERASALKEADQKDAPEPEAPTKDGIDPRASANPKEP